MQKMLITHRQNSLDNLTESDKQKLLFEQQKKTLDLFLERRAITKEQYDLSLNTLVEKMEL